MPDRFAYDSEGHFLGLPAFIQLEALKLAEKMDEATAQIAAIAATTPDEARSIVEEFYAQVVVTGPRAFQSFSATDVVDWANKRG